MVLVDGTYLNGYYGCALSHRVHKMQIIAYLFLLLKLETIRTANLEDGFWKT